MRSLMDLWHATGKVSLNRLTTWLLFTILQALIGMGSEFLSGYIVLAEGEKDPRNLLLSFAIARVLLIEFDVSRHVEVGCSISPIRI